MSDLTQSQMEAYDRLYGGSLESAQDSTKPGVFTGWYKFASGVPGGAAGGILSAASSATDTEVNPDEGLFGFNDIINPIIHPTIEQMRQSAADYYRPDPQTTGWVGNTLYGVTDVLTRATIGNAAAPGAGLTFAAGTTGFERAKELEAQGVDPNTASISGAIQGGSLLASGGLSSIGTSQASRIISGAGLNIAFGSGARALDSSVLRANGYEAQAAQQEWNDSSSIIADGIIGAAFHVLPHAHEVPRPSADEVDAALTAKNHQNVVDTAPGVPADPISAGAHVDAMDLAHDQLTDGQEVNVAPVVRDATFVPRPEAPPRSMPEVGTVIDNRLAALDELATGVRSKEDLADLGKEAGDLEDLLRQQYSARDNNVTQAPENQLTADELSFAENRLSNIQQQFEANRQAVAARNEVARLRQKLAGAEDSDLRQIAEQIAPTSSAEVRAAQSMRDGLEAAGISRADIQEALRPSDEQITGNLAEKLGNHDAAVQEYSRNPDSAGGTILNTDIARELSPDYLKDRTRSAPVHEGASAFIKRLYAEKLAGPTPEGFDRVVRFTAGGTGAGKTTALKSLEEIGRPEITFDTNMNTLASADKKVKQALDAGRDVQILYVYRDPVDALVHGAIKRANRQAEEFGTGRTVPLGEHAKTHLGVRSVMEALAEKYKDNPHVEIRAFDNSRGKDLGRFAALEDIPRIEENGLHERLQTALDQERRAGRVSDATYAGFNERGRPVLGEAGLPDASGVQRRSVQGAGGQPQSERGSRAGSGVSEPDVPDAQASQGADSADGRAGQTGPGEARADTSAEQRSGLDPARAADVERARSIVEANPEAVLDDGTTAGEALRAADDDVKQAHQTGEAIKAAVACFLRFGSDVA